MKLAILTSAEVDRIWPIFAAGMREACDRTGGAMGPGEIWTMARSGNAYAVAGVDDGGAVFLSVWRFETWASGPVFRCLALCGSRSREWFRDLHDLAERLAADGGTSRLVAQGRPGWARLARRYLNKRVRPLFETYEVI